MPKPINLRSYLESIKDITLPEPHSQVTRDFVEYVVKAHSWYKLPWTQSPVDLMAFNLFIGPGPLIEAQGAENERVYEGFQHLKYGVPGHPLFDVRAQLPREIYDAGLAVVPGNYASEQSQQIMGVTIANMLEAIKEYRQRDPSARRLEERITGCSPRI